MRIRFRRAAVCVLLISSLSPLAACDGNGSAGDGGGFSGDDVEAACAAAGVGTAEWISTWDVRGRLEAFAAAAAAHGLNQCADRVRSNAP